MRRTAGHRDQVSSAVARVRLLVCEELGADAVDLNLGCPQWRLSWDLELPSRGAASLVFGFLVGGAVHPEEGEVGPLGSDCGCPVRVSSAEERTQDDRWLFPAVA